MKKIKIAKVFIVICEVFLIVLTTLDFLGSLFFGMIFGDLLNGLFHSSFPSDLMTIGVVFTTIIFGFSSVITSVGLFILGLFNSAKLFLTSISWYKINKWKSKKDINTAFILCYVCVGLGGLLNLVPAIILSTVKRNELNIRE